MHETDEPATPSSRLRRILWMSGFTAGVATLLLGLLVVFGWHTGNRTLRDSFWRAALPTRPNDSSHTPISQPQVLQTATLLLKSSDVSIIRRSWPGTEIHCWFCTPRLTA